MKKHIVFIKNNIEYFRDIEIHFIGTGLSNSSKGRFSISQLADKMNLLNNIIFEKPERLTYFELLQHISQSSGIFILGSTESHYTPSKLFNAFVTQKPVFAILNSGSTAKNIIEDTNWGLVCTYPNENKHKFEEQIINKFSEWKSKVINEKWNFDFGKAKIYSAYNISSQLAKVLNETVK